MRSNRSAPCRDTTACGLASTLRPRPAKPLHRRGDPVEALAQRLEGDRQRPPHIALPLAPDAAARADDHAVLLPEPAGELGPRQARRADVDVEIERALRIPIRE